MTSHGPEFLIQHEFHNFEIAFCGHSGSGKTTLIEKLAQNWIILGYNFAYIKHDAHSFEMDTAGKDTYRINQAGASAVFISNSKQSAYLSNTTSTFPLKLALSCHDFVVIEGYKNLPIPKIVVLNQSTDVIHELESSKAQILCIVGTSLKPPPLPQWAVEIPYLNRDQINNISDLIDRHFQHINATTPLYGLVLAGGKSKRMGMDKAQLMYTESLNQLEITSNLLKPYCQNVFISARNEQEHLYHEMAKLDVISDSFLNFGPVGGILSAMRAHPGAAWMVLAVDLPLMDNDTLEHLVESRGRGHYATVYQSSHAHFIEPLCGIYEPKCYKAFLNLLGSGIQCPTSMLKSLGVKILTPPNSILPFSNANTPQDFSTLKDQLRSPHGSAH